MNDTEEAAQSSYHQDGQYPLTLTTWSYKSKRISELVKLTNVSSVNLWAVNS